MPVSPLAAHGAPVLADATVNVVLCPAQRVALVGVIVGVGNTVNKTASSAEHPLLVPVKVYVVVVVALNGVLFVTPLFQAYVVAPEPERVTCVPAKTV